MLPAGEASAAYALWPNSMPARPAPMNPPIRPVMNGWRWKKPPPATGAAGAGRGTACGAVRPGLGAVFGVTLRSIGLDIGEDSWVREPRLPWLLLLPAAASARVGASASTAQLRMMVAIRRR